MSDYIERKAAYRFCKEQLEKETGAYTKGRNSGLKVAMAAVMNKDAIPAADVRPVVHARWAWRGFNIQCPICGFEPLFDSTEPLYHYCPDCGADMEGEEE